MVGAKVAMPRRLKGNETTPKLRRRLPGGTWPREDEDERKGRKEGRGTTRGHDGRTTRRWRRGQEEK